MSDNLPEKSSENKDSHLQELPKFFRVGFNTMMQREDFVNFLNDHHQACCPVQFYYTKDEEGKNVINGLVVNTTPQSPEKFAKAIMDITGINDIGLANKLCDMAARAVPGNPHEGMAIILQSLNNYKPKNAIEAGLVAQATVLEMQGLRYLERAESAEFLSHRDSAINSATKLLRLQHETLEVLNRQRRGNEQRIVIQHQNVQVNDGGKAVIAGQMTGVGGGQQ